MSMTVTTEKFPEAEQKGLDLLDQSIKDLQKSVEIINKQAKVIEEQKGIIEFNEEVTRDLGNRIDDLKKKGYKKNETIQELEKEIEGLKKREKPAGSWKGTAITFFAVDLALIAGSMYFGKS